MSVQNSALEIKAILFIRKKHQGWTELSLNTNPCCSSRTVGQIAGFGKCRITERHCVGAFGGTDMDLNKVWIGPRLHAKISKFLPDFTAQCLVSWRSSPMTGPGEFPVWGRERERSSIQEPRLPHYFRLVVSGWNQDVQQHWFLSQVRLQQLSTRDFV